MRARLVFLVTSRTSWWSSLPEILPTLVLPHVQAPTANQASGDRNNQQSQGTERSANGKTWSDGGRSQLIEYKEAGAAETGVLPSVQCALIRPRKPQAVLGQIERRSGATRHAVASRSREARAELRALAVM